MKPRPSLVPEPSSLRDFSTHLKSNILSNSDDEISQSLQPAKTVVDHSAVATGRPHPHDTVKKTTFRPPTLLRTSPNLVAAAAAAAREATNRHFNDLWIRLENGVHPYVTR